MPAKYAWKITKVNAEFDAIQDEVGTIGPCNVDEALLNVNPTRFRMYSDDNEFCYEGVLGGDYDGFEPLYDFGLPNAGCTILALPHDKKPPVVTIDLVIEKADGVWWKRL